MFGSPKYYSLIKNNIYADLEEIIVFSTIKFIIFVYSNNYFNFQNIYMFYLNRNQFVFSLHEAYVVHDIISLVEKLCHVATFNWSQFKLIIKI